MIKFIVSNESKNIFKIIGLSIFFPLIISFFNLKLALIALYVFVAIAALTLGYLHVKKKTVVNKELHNEHDCSHN